MKAKAMRLLYYLKTEDVKDNELSKMWLIHFLNQSTNIEKSLASKKMYLVAGFYREARETWEG